MKKVFTLLKIVLVFVLLFFMTEILQMNGTAADWKSDGITFSSLWFLVLFAVLFLIFFCFPKKYASYQWVILLIAGFVFYASYGIILMIPLAVTTVSVWSGAVWIEKIAEYYSQRMEKSEKNRKNLKQLETRKKRGIVALVLLLNLGILCMCKYSNFAIRNINVLLYKGNCTVHLQSLNLLVPLGISFYTLQSLGYLFDVYKGKYKADRNIFKFALFVTYFPQLVQGPISRYSSLTEQLFEEHRFDYDRVKSGFLRILWGYIKKLVIADRIAILVNEVFGGFEGIQPGEPFPYKGIVIFLAGLFYGVQIYAGFSGSMDIVCGISEVLGIQLTENFRRPFFAGSVIEFWQRWHITLGAWMRDYLFYPLARSKAFEKMSRVLLKTGSTYLANVLPGCLASSVAFVTIGIWHGAHERYIIYGMYHAFFVSTAILMEPLYALLRSVLGLNVECYSFKIFRIVRTVFIITIGRFLLIASTTHRALAMLQAMVSEFNLRVLFDGSLYELGLVQKNFHFMLLTILILFLVDFVQERGIHIRNRIARLDVVMRWSVYLLGIFALIIYGVYDL